MNSWGYEKPKTAARIFSAPSTLPYFGFLHSSTYSSAIQKNSFGSTGTSDLLLLDPLNTCSWNSFNYHLVWVTNMLLLLYVLFPDGLKLFPVTRPVPS